jgi:hypothetical protein
VLAFEQGQLGIGRKQAVPGRGAELLGERLSTVDERGRNGRSARLPVREQQPATGVNGTAVTSFG